MKNFLYVLAFFVFTAPAMAQSAAHEDIVIKVNGMVCDFCAQSVMKVFEEYEQVEKVDIDLTAGTVTVHTKPGMSLDEASLDKGIKYAGYELVSVERVQNAGHDS